MQFLLACLTHCLCKLTRQTTLQAATRIHQLEQHVQQLQQEAQTAGALEYRCEGLLQEKQQLAQQLQHLKGTSPSMHCTTTLGDSLH